MITNSSKSKQTAAPEDGGDNGRFANMPRGYTSFVTFGVLLRMVSCGPSNFAVYSKTCYCPQVTLLTDDSSHPPLFSAPSRVDAATADFQLGSYRTRLEAGGVHRFFSHVFESERIIPRITQVLCHQEDLTRLQLVARPAQDEAETLEPGSESQRAGGPRRPVSHAPTTTAKSIETPAELLRRVAKAYRRRRGHLGELRPDERRPDRTAISTKMMADQERFCRTHRR